MDAMALLCNLQADGPTTLRRLHVLGCRTLRDLARADLFALAGALGGDAAHAQRFVREAAALEARLGADALEPEEAGPAARATRATGRERAAGPGPTHAPAHVVGLAPSPQPAPRSTKQSSDADRRAPASTPSPALGAALAGARRASGPAGELRLQPSGTPLCAGAIDGLDEGWCRALVGQGILTLEALRDAPGLSLARALARPLTALVGLQCLARRHLDQAPRALATLERDDEPTRVLVPPPRRPLADPDQAIFAPAPSSAAVSGSAGARALSSAAGDSEHGGPFA